VNHELKREVAVVCTISAIRILVAASSLSVGNTVADEDLKEHIDWNHERWAVMLGLG
jgi:hypothetical protein